MPKQILSAVEELSLVRQKDSLHIGNFPEIAIYKDKEEKYWFSIGYLQYNPNLRNKICDAGFIPKEAIYQTTEHDWFVRSDYFVMFLQMLKQFFARELDTGQYQRMTCAECPHIVQKGSMLVCDITGTDVIGYVEAQMRNRLVYEGALTWCNQWEPRENLKVEALRL